MTGKNKFIGLSTETNSCFRCGSPRGELKTLWNDVYYVCRRCECEAEEIVEEVSSLYLNGESDCFIGIRAKEIPELKRLFSQSESEDIRKLVKFLEDVEADIWPKEAKE